MKPLVRPPTDRYYPAFPRDLIDRPLITLITCLAAQPGAS
jgi:hypothetical protein